MNIKDDGIYYTGNEMHLNFQIIFEDESMAHAFESAVIRIPSMYRIYNQTGSADSDDISVTLQPLQVLLNDTTELKRIFREQYHKIDDDNDPSYEYDTLSTISINPITKLKLIDAENSAMFLRQNPEKCHLFNQSKYKEHSRNPNNIVYMSRFLYQQFAAINSTEGIPQFYFEYVSHSDQSLEVEIDDKACTAYETIVNIVFYDSEIKDALCPFMCNHTIKSTTEIQIKLYFENPREFKTFATMNKEATYCKWRSYNGIST